MAEFRLACFNSIHHTSYRERDVMLEDDYCEGCGEWKPCVVRLYPPSLFSRIRKQIIRCREAAKEKPKNGK